MWKGLSMCGYNRLRFLLQSLKDLEQQFAAHGIRFMCFYGEPHHIIDNLIQVYILSTFNRLFSFVSNEAACKSTMFSSIFF